MSIHASRSRAKTYLPIGILAMIALASTLTYQVCRAEPDKKSDDLKIDKLAWMAGKWEGTLFGGPIQEHWTRAETGAMVGMCAMGADPTKAVYEFLMIEEKDGVPIMFIRHFGQHSAGREERALEFRMTKAEKNRVVFESDDKKTTFSKVTYSLSKEGEYIVGLDGEHEGKKHHIEGRLKRAK